MLLAVYEGYPYTAALAAAEVPYFAATGAT